MSTRSKEFDDDYHHQHRTLSTGEWNQQTIVDARNVLQTQQSNDSSNPSHDARPGKSKKENDECFGKKIERIFLLLVGKPLIYPNHVLHPEVIPSLNDVPAELIKRRNTRFLDPTNFDSFEAELPLAIATSLQDELERAVQHRF